MDFYLVFLLDKTCPLSVNETFRQYYGGSYCKPSQHSQSTECKYSLVQTACLFLRD